MVKIVMKRVDSSQIRSVGYDPQKNILYIEFTNGTVYKYIDVPIGDFNALCMLTMSVGKYFYAEIKGKYEYEKLDVLVREGEIEV